MIAQDGGCRHNPGESRWVTWLQGASRYRRRWARRPPGLALGDTLIETLKARGSVTFHALEG